MMALCLVWIYLHGGMGTVGEACVLCVDYLPTRVSTHTTTQQAQHTTRDAHSHLLIRLQVYSRVRLERGPAGFATVWLRYRLMSRSCMALRPGWPARAELGLVRPPRRPGPRPRRANHPFAGLLGERGREPVICLCALCAVCARLRALRALRARLCALRAASHMAPSWPQPHHVCVCSVSQPSTVRSSQLSKYVPRHVCNVSTDPRTPRLPHLDCRGTLPHALLAISDRPRAPEHHRITDTLGPGT
jgi:hypothetical protein